MKILVIDDDDESRAIIRMSLERVGAMQVSDAASGAEGLRMARRDKPDAILLDVMMPEMNGPATLAALRDDPETASIPVVFVTAHVAPEELLMIQGLSAAGVIAKPFDPMKLTIQLLDLLTLKPRALDL